MCPPEPVGRAFRPSPRSIGSAVKPLFDAWSGVAKPNERTVVTKEQRNAKPPCADSWRPQKLLVAVGNWVSYLFGDQGRVGSISAFCRRFLSVNLVGAILYVLFETSSTQVARTAATRLGLFLELLSANLGSLGTMTGEAVRAPVSIYVVVFLILIAFFAARIVHVVP